MDFYIVGECPICFEAGDLLALLDRSDKGLLFYCPACGSTWDKLPDGVDEINSLEELAPDGVVCPSREELQSHGVLQFEVTDVYESLDDIT